MRHYLSLLALCLCLMAFSADSIFTSPIHYKMTLAGNFGEPRPNHFHGGIDVKTEHVEGKAIYSIGEGYVVKVSVNTDGFGKAVYVRHPNGMTSVYAHLSDFAPRLRCIVNSYRAVHHCDTLAINLQATQMPVSRGQLIAFSGNTGHSMGPHLHLEVHETQTDNLLDPLAFMTNYVEDRVAPIVRGIKAYPVPGEGYFATADVFNDSTKGLWGWGRVGFALRADDKMDSVPNHYGIRYTEFYVDGKLAFRSDVNGIPKKDHPLVNVWGDSAYFYSQHEWFMKSFIEPRNTLPILHADENKGYVIFNEQRPYHLKYVLSDIFGNKTVKEFVVEGRRR